MEEKPQTSYQSAAGEPDQLLLSVAGLIQSVEELDKIIRQLDINYRLQDELYQVVPLVRTSKEEQDYIRYKRLSDQAYIPNSFTKLLCGLGNIEDFIQEHQDLLAQPDLEEMVAAALSKLSQMLKETLNLCEKKENDYRILNAKFLLHLGKRVEAASDLVWDVLALLASKAVPELDKTVVDSVETTSTMGGVEEGSIQEPASVQPKPQVGEQAGEHASRSLIYEVKQLPPGVDPKQIDFLQEASEVKAFSWLHPDTAKMIAVYYTTPLTYTDIAKEYRITKQAVQDRITRGIAQLRRVLYQEKPEIAEEDRYPLEQIKKGKERLEVVRSERSRLRSSNAKLNKFSSSRTEQSSTQSEQNVVVFIAKPPHSK